MQTLDLIPLAWAVVTAFVVAACQVSSWADGPMKPSELRRRASAQAKRQYEEN